MEMVYFQYRYNMGKNMFRLGTTLSLGLVYKRYFISGTKLGREICSHMIPNLNFFGMDVNFSLCNWSSLRAVAKDS